MGADSLAVLGLVVIVLWLGTWIALVTTPGD